MLCAKDLKVGYEDRIIIDNLNLSIKQGEIVSIIGPNGCGKSTLLKTLSRMISPISGKVYFKKMMSELQDMSENRYYLITALKSNSED